MSVDVCYVLSHGFSARMILHSTLVPELVARGLRVGIVTADVDDPALVDLERRLGITVERAPFRTSKLQNLVFHHLQRYLFEDIERNPALRAKQLRDAAANGQTARLGHKALSTLNSWAIRTPRLRETARKLQRSLLVSSSVRAVLARLAPTLLVSTYPVNVLEASFLLAARRSGIRTVGHLLSWDNITCKGRFPVDMDHFLSWGPVMTAELFEHYNVAANDVYECGVPHFDHHARPDRTSVSREVITSLRLDPDKPYVFFGMSSPYFAPREIDIVEWLAKRVSGGSFGAELQLVIRPHPQNVQGSMADLKWLARLDNLVGERVAVDTPRLQTGHLAWNMRRDDLPQLVGLLAGCAVCVNSGSTLSIDAILHDRPVVLTSFDSTDALPWWQSARRVLEYHHIAKLVSLGGVRVTRSYEALEAALHAYLLNPGLDASARAYTRREECGACDGRASARAAMALSELARPAAGTRTS